MTLGNPTSGPRYADKTGYPLIGPPLEKRDPPFLVQTSLDPLSTNPETLSFYSSVGNVTPGILFHEVRDTG